MLSIQSCWNCSSGRYYQRVASGQSVIALMARGGQLPFEANIGSIKNVFPPYYKKWWHFVFAEGT